MAEPNDRERLIEELRLCDRAGVELLNPECLKAPIKAALDEIDELRERCKEGDEDLEQEEASHTATMLERNQQAATIAEQAAEIERLKDLVAELAAQRDRYRAMCNQLQAELNELRRRL